MAPVHTSTETEPLASSREEPVPAVDAPPHVPRRRWSLRRMLALLTVVTFLPLAVLTYSAISLSTRAVVAEARSRVQGAATLEAGGVTARMEGLRLLVRSFVGRPSVETALADPRAPDLAMLQQQLQSVVDVDPGLASASITDVSGRLVAIAPATPTAIGRDFSDRDWYQGVHRSGEAYVSGAFQSATGSEPLIVAIAAPIRDATGDTVIGYAFLGYHLEAIKSFVRDFAAGHGVLLTVTDQHGVIVAAPTQPSGLVSVARETPVRRALTGKTGVLSERGPTGRTVTGYAPVPIIGWTVHADVLESTAFGRVSGLRATVGGVAALLAACLVVVLFLVGRAWRTQARTEAELDKTVVDLARSNQELEEFAYVASHDLSEPLRAISGPISLVARRYQGQLDPEADRFIEFAVDGCQRMQTMINDLLSYSRVGRLEGAMSAVDTAQVVETVLSELAPIVQETGAQIDVGSLPVVIGESTQLAQLFQNLVSNALKFVAPGAQPHVRIAATLDGQDWRFTVTDNGIGVAPEYRERIFGMFKRLHSREEYAGTGIGLALAKKIVERHGGRIGVDDNPDGGSRFWFTVPVRKKATR